MINKENQKTDSRFDEIDFQAVVPSRALNDRSLSRTDLQVYAALISFLRPGHTKVWPKRRTISLRCKGLLPTNVTRATTRLVERGYIAKEAVENAGGVIYHFVNMKEARGAFERWKSFMPDIDLINDNPQWFIHNQPNIGPRGLGIGTTEKLRREMEKSGGNQRRNKGGEGISPDTPPLMYIDKHAEGKNHENAYAFSCPEMNLTGRKSHVEYLFSRPEFEVKKRSAEVAHLENPHADQGQSQNPVDQPPVDEGEPVEAAAATSDPAEDAYSAVHGFLIADGVKVLPGKKKRSRRPISADSGHSEEPAIVEIPVTGRIPGPFKVTQAMIDRYKDLFPGIDPVEQAKRAAQWCEDNPKRRKTMAGCQSFLTKWMGRAQDDSRAYRGHFRAPQQLQPDGPDPSGVGYWLKGKRYPNESVARAAYGDISHYKHNPDDPEDALKHAMREVYGEESGW